MRPYTTIPEVLWKVDPLVEEARRVPAWRHFHRACGKRDLFFDHVERKGKTRVYGAVAFTLGKVRDQWWSYHVADAKREVRSRPCSTPMRAKPLRNIATRKRSYGRSGFAMAGPPTLLRRRNLRRPRSTNSKNCSAALLPPMTKMISRI